MFTPEQLVLEMNRRGCEVTERRLRDWRRKGLLPPLSRHSLGRALGVVNGWEDDAVLGQAMTIAELLARTSRTDRACLGAWCAGYPMNIEQVRKAWLSSLDRTRMQLLGDSFDVEQLEEAIGILSHRLAKKLPSEVLLQPEDVDALLTETLNGFFNSSYEFAIDEHVAGVARIAMNLNHRVDRGSEILDAVFFNKTLIFVQKNLSHDARRDLILSVTAKELEVAHQRWISVIQTIARFSASKNGGQNPSELVQTGRGILFTFGELCIFALLYLDRDGKGCLIDKQLSSFQAIFEPCSAGLDQPMEIFVN